MSVFDSLAGEPRWVAWRNEQRGDKLTKVPYSPTGRKAKADDPSTRGSQRAAQESAHRIVNGLGGGIGIELGDLGGDLFLAGIDLDSCLSDDGMLADWARPFLAVVPSYTEISPSGRGLKAFFYVATEDVRPFLELAGVADPRQWGLSRSIPGERPKTGHGPGIELYTSGRYFAVTENRWPDQPDTLAMLDWSALQQLAQLIPPTAEPSPADKGNGADNSRSAVAFRKGMALKAAGKSFEEMVEALRTDPETAHWCREKGNAYGGRELRRIWERAAGSSPRGRDGVSLNDFYAYMPMHNYIFVPTRATWPGASVNSRIPPIKLTDDNGAPILDKDGKQIVLTASAWLDRFKPVEQTTWVPGEPMIIDDRLIIEGGWIDRTGVRCFNQYLPPSVAQGDPEKADPWIDHVKYVFPEEADHIFDWLAHRVKYPDDKINHALVLGGFQGIGKDSILDPVKYAVGPWNFQEASPPQILGRFNSFLKSVILRVSEAHDLGEFDRFQLYDRMKTYTAAPPDTLRIDEKHLREYPIPNCCGVIITTNHKTDGIYLPADDRRHFVTWSDKTKEDKKFQDGYWDRLWACYDNGGRAHVAAFLQTRDISKFNAKAPPPRTPAFWGIVDANRPAEESELADILDEINRNAVTLLMLQARAKGGFGDWLRDRKNRRIIRHRLEQCGFVPVRNPTADDGLWKINGKRQAVYAKAALSTREQIQAAQSVTQQPGDPYEHARD